MKVMYDNLTLDATIDSLTENPYYLFEDAFNDTRLSRVARTLDDAAQWVKFTFTGAVTATDIIIDNHNITTGATVTLEANATDVWTSPSLSVSITPVAGVIYKTFASSNYQYWRLTINDASNADTYIQIGNVFLGLGVTLAGFSPGVYLPKKSNSESNLSISRQLTGMNRIKYKYCELDFVSITYTEKEVIETFIEFVDVTMPFYALLWEDNAATDPPVYCAFEDYPVVTKDAGYGDLYSTKFKISEVF
jgi:hypothetical protein